MADLPVPNLVVQSHNGPYNVHFVDSLGQVLEGLADTHHLLMDARVAQLYAKPFAKLLSGRSVLTIEPLEKNKSLEMIPSYIAHLLERGVRRRHTLVAIGGGIVQDITAFIASCLLRGVPWVFYPTTLLAQADSCIGSKSSINVGAYKNQVGTFTPPREVWVASQFLDTLPEADIRSGIGEIIKTHILAGWDDVRTLARDYSKLFKDRQTLMSHIVRALEIKKEKIEADEFDQNVRLVMNYGHTFGHAIESATDYKIPHGIAVTLGMDLANFVSMRTELLPPDAYQELHTLMVQNYRGFEEVPIPRDAFYQALLKDKKNVDHDVTLVLLKGPGQVFVHKRPLDEPFKAICEAYFSNLKLQKVAS